MKTTTKLASLFLLIALLFVPGSSHAQTAFTYQGQLRDGSTNANGTYALTFALFDAPGGGSQVGSTLTAPSLPIVNGLFTVALDFGGTAFDGKARWLQITVGADVLAPRVAVLPAPYALFAAVAGTVTNRAIMNAQLAFNAVATTNIQNNAITTALIADGAVTNRNLAANAVNVTNIASGQVVKGLNGLTDTVTLSAGANVSLFTNGNSLQISAGVPNIELFRTNGTFTVPTNVTRIMVELWGAGGGGGSAYTTVVCKAYDGIGNCIQTDSSTRAGGGGGAGGYAWNVFSVIPGASYTVTFGVKGGGSVSTNGGFAGGTTSFGALMSAGGGSAGGNATTFTEGGGGVGGSTSGGLAGNGTSGGSGRSSANGEGGLGGSVFRGGGPYQNGPGAGGQGGGGDNRVATGTVIGGGASNHGEDGKTGAILIYY